MKARFLSFCGLVYLYQKIGCTRAHLHANPTKFLTIILLPLNLILSSVKNKKNCRKSNVNCLVERRPSQLGMRHYIDKSYMPAALKYPVISRLTKKTLAQNWSHTQARCTKRGTWLIQ